MKAKNPQQHYWKNREAKGENGFGLYALAEAGRGKLVGDALVQNKIGKRSRVLEVGCNVGRNLMSLQERGFQRLYGFDINEDAINAAESHFPKLSASMIASTAEDYFKDNRSFDAVFSMAVLCHLPEPGAKDVFAGMANSFSKLLITIEDEVTMGQRHFARNYEKIFTEFGLTQISSKPVEGLKHMDNYVVRVFKNA